MLGDRNVTLPQDAVQRIFEFLGRDVLQAVLVSRDWSLFLNHKRFWKAIKIKIDRNNASMVMASYNRLDLVGEIELHHMEREKMPELFRYLAADQTLNGKTLKCVCYCCEKNNYVSIEELKEEDIVFGLVDPVDLALVVTRLHHFEVDCPKKFRWLSDNQTEHIISILAQSANLPLKYMKLGDNTFLNCTPERYAAAMMNLEQIEIYFSRSPRHF